MLFIALSSAAPDVGGAEHPPPPAQVVERLHAELVSIDERFSGQTVHEQSFATRTAALTPVIEQTHDLAYMARLSIKARWDALDEGQREQFSRDFRDLSVTTYGARFRDLTDIRFSVTDERRMPRGRSEVRTELVAADGTVVELNYLLHETPDGWLIINVLADGVSELALKRSQYQQILQTQDFAALLEYIRGQQDDLQREASAEYAETPG